MDKMTDSCFCTNCGSTDQMEFYTHSDKKNNSVFKSALPDWIWWLVIAIAVIVVLIFIIWAIRPNNSGFNQDYGGTITEWDPMSSASRIAHGIDV